MDGRCNARGRSGVPCRRSAGWGTDHRGVGRCSSHTGSTTNGKKHAIKLTAEALHAELALLVDLDTSEEDPLQGLLLAHRIKRMEVIWYTQKIAELEPDEVTLRPLAESMGGKDAVVADLRGAETANIWIQLRDAAVKDLAKYAKDLLAAGLDERRVAAEERWADDIAEIIGRVLDLVELTGEQRKRVPSIFQLVLGGAAA